MSEAKKHAWLEYLTFLGVALFMALAFFPLWSSIPANPILICALSALIFGNGFYFITYIRTRIRMRLFWTNLVVQTALMFGCILVSSGLLFWLFGWLQVRTSPFDARLWQGMAEQIPRLHLPISLPLGLLIAGAINAFFQFDRKLGPGVLWNWVTGKYYNPREEELVLMFLDLKASTSLAEQLGPLKFSALIRDFFADLTGPIVESGGSVSHYIGDEAVIYWKPKKALQNNACIKMFFAFQKALALKSPHYEASYGVTPAFKAALHLGIVVATEVGEIKSEIVFHGDTLNTTARIQGLCNQLDRALLVSSAVKDRLENSGCTFESMGVHELKGKGEGVALYAPIPQL